MTVPAPPPPPDPPPPDGAQVAEQLRRAQEAGGIGLFAVGPDGIIEPSPTFCRLYGVEPAPALPARVFEELVVPEDRALVSTAATRASGIAPVDVEYRIRRADTGELRWIARTGEIEQAPDGSFRRFTGVARDVTDQVVLRRALAEEREQLAQMFEQAPTVMALLEGPDHRVVRANPGFVALIGGRDTIGRPLRDALPDAVEQGALRVLDRVYRTGEPYHATNSRYDARIAPDAPARTHYLNLVFQPIRDGEGRVGGIFIEGADVTARTRVEEELRALAAQLEARVEERTRELMAAEEQLRQSQKMEAIGQLTGGIAHDFNNMLTGIIGSIDLIQRNLANGRMDRVERYLETASASAQRAAALTARLLAFGRRQALDLQSVEVNALIEGIADLLRRTLGEQVALDIDLAPDAWPARTDHNQLENALLNLCINARDAMPGGGRLTIATANATMDGTDGQRDGRYLVLSVSDDGVGMSPEVVERAFEPFFTTKPVGQGTGLGLSMIYGFARQSGGLVEIDSTPGAGTSVRLYLPRFVGDHGDAGAHDGDAPRGAGETVMIVEDDPSVRMIVLDVLEELGYDAIEARDGAEAMPILRSGRRIDLLVTDVGLPGMNGREIADLARESRPDLKILFVTGYAESATARAGLLDRGMAMVTKPFAVDLLATRIRQMLGDRDG